jgi:hypothetical protein
MPEPHPLNQAVIAQALHDLRNGQLRRARAMGFDEADLEMLKRPAAVSILANATVSWCSVTINRDALHCLFERVSEVSREIDEIDRLLRLGASTEIIHEFYGLTHQEIALRRMVIGLPRRKGRHRALSDEESAELWRRCAETVEEAGIDPLDKKAMLRMAADMAEQMALPIAVIWSALSGWIDAKQF